MCSKVELLETVVLYVGLDYEQNTGLMDRPSCLLLVPHRAQTL